MLIDFADVMEQTVAQPKEVKMAEVLGMTWGPRSSSTIKCQTAVLSFVLGHFLQLSNYTLGPPNLGVGWGVTWIHKCLHCQLN